MGSTKFFVGVNELTVVAVFERFDLLQDVFELHAVSGFDAFADESQGVAVGNGAVVVVFVDVVAEKDA